MQCLVVFHFHQLHPPVRRHPLAPSRVVEASEGHVEESAVNQWQDLTPNFALSVWVSRSREPQPNSQTFDSFEISWQDFEYKVQGFNNWFVKCSSSCLRKAYARWRSMMVSDGFKRSTTAKLHSKSWNTKTGKFNAHQCTVWADSPSTFILRKLIHLSYISPPARLSICLPIYLQGSSPHTHTM